VTTQLNTRGVYLVYLESKKKNSNFTSLCGLQMVSSHKDSLGAGYSFNGSKSMVALVLCMLKLERC